MSRAVGTTNEPSTETTVLERPPEGLARGRFPVPAWAALVLGAVIALAGTLYFARRLAKRVKP